MNFDNPFRDSYGTVGVGPYKPIRLYENYRDSDSGYETANSFSEGGSKSKKSKTKTNKTRNKQKFL
jgi:hypothetical protein